jgi:hypothetical protein
LKEPADPRRSPFAGKNQATSGKLDNKRLIRLAALIYAKYIPASQSAGADSLLTLSLKPYSKQLKQLNTLRQICLEKHWQVAEADIRRQMQETEGREIFCLVDYGSVSRSERTPGRIWRTELSPQIRGAVRYY